MAHFAKDAEYVISLVNLEIGLAEIEPGPGQCNPFRRTNAKAGFHLARAQRRQNLIRIGRIPRCRAAFFEPARCRCIKSELFAKRNGERCVP